MLDSYQKKVLFHSVTVFHILGQGGAHGGQNANATLSAVRLKLRPFFVEHIPVVVRKLCKLFLFISQMCIVFHARKSK